MPLITGCCAAQSYAKHVHEFKESAGLKEVSIGYVVAGDLAATPKSAQYSLLRKGALDEKDVKRLQKSPAVRRDRLQFFGMNPADSVQAVEAEVSHAVQHGSMSLVSAVRCEAIIAA